MESSPADHRATQIHERFVDVSTFVESRPQPSELMQQRLGLLNQVAKDAKPAPVRLSASRDGGSDAAAREDHPSVVVVVRPVAHHVLWLAQWRAGLAADGGIASTSGINCVTSCVLAPVRMLARGTPPASTTRWCLEPDFLRSTGLGPVFSLRAPHGRKPSRRRLARSRSGVR